MIQSSLWDSSLSRRIFPALKCRAIFAASLRDAKWPESKASVGTQNSQTPAGAARPTKAVAVRPRSKALRPPAKAAVVRPHSKALRPPAKAVAVRPHSKALRRPTKAVAVRPHSKALRAGCFFSCPGRWGRRGVSAIPTAQCNFCLAPWPNTSPRWLS